MKLYTKVQTLKTKSLVGVVLVGDKNQIYMTNGFETQTSDEKEASLLGIQRAISFIKNVSPIYANENLEIYGSKNSVNEIKNNDYISKFLQMKKIDVILNNNFENEFDKQMNIRVNHEIIGLSWSETFKNYKGR